MQEAATIRTIGKYKILGTLGRGAMGVVYRGQDPEIGRIVAIKILRKLPGGASPTDNRAIERFKIEARSAGNLRHPHIITVFDVNIEGDTPYIVMDYIEGEGLDAIIQREKKLDPRQMIHYLWQVASGLDYAHSRGIIHRDIKPSNILVDKSENVFILDFGVASFGGVANKDEPVMGTPSYMSPEQILHRDLDVKSDLFSLGVVAFECVAGQKPFPGHNFSEIVNNILNAKPLSTLDIAPDVPLALEVELQRSLAKNKEDRFASAEAMIGAFAKGLGFDLQMGAATGAPRRRRLSDWRSIKTERDSGVHARPEPRRRADTPRDLSPWRPEQRTVDASSFKMTQQSGSRATRPGEMYVGSDEDLMRSSSISRSPMRSLTWISGVVLVVLSFILFLMVYRRGGSEESSSRITGTEILVEDTTPDDQSLDSFGDINEPKIEAVPAGVPIAAMNDRQVIGVLVDETMSESITLEAMREAKTRRLPDLVDASVHLLNRDSYIVRIETLKTLAEIGDRRIVPHVVVVLDDHDHLVRRWAAKALAKMGDRRALGYLQARLVREDLEEVKFDIRKAIERITGIPYAK